MFPLLALGAGGFLANLLGGIIGAKSQSDIAAAQLAEQEKTRNLAMGVAGRTTEEMALMGQQLEQYSRMNSFQQQELSRIQESLGAMNPQFGEVSKQLYGALKGEKTAWMTPIEAERARGREAIQAQTQERMGGGAGQSTAGLGAVSNYDYQTGQLLANAQLQGINTLSGLQGNTAGIMSNLSGQAFGGAQAVAGMGQNIFAENSSIANRMIGAINATPTTPYVGGQFFGGAALGAGLQSFGNQLGNMSMMGMQGAFKKSPEVTSV